VVPPPPFDIKSTWGWTTTAAAALYWMIAHTYNNNVYTDENAFKRFDIEWVSQRLWGGAARLTGGTHREGENGGKNEQKVHLGYLSL
jgi:hypothetical protein